MIIYLKCYFSFKGAETLIEISLRDSCFKNTLTPLKRSTTPITNVFDKPQRMYITDNKSSSGTDFFNQIDNPSKHVFCVDRNKITLADEPMSALIRLENKEEGCTEDTQITESVRSPPVVQQENSHINQPEKILSSSANLSFLLQKVPASDLNIINEKYQTTILKKPIKYTSRIEICEPKGVIDSVNTSQKPIARSKMSQWNIKKVFQRDGKVYIIDPLQTKLRKQSLLKPQISLLRSHKPSSPIKPRSNRTASFLHSDHDYIKLRSSSEIVVRKILGHNFSKELEQQFWSIRFANLKHAIDFLLRKLPLVSPMANDPYFKNCYPFIVLCSEEYRKLGRVKQFTHEWLRAKYINKCIYKHNNLKKAATWTTKEIIVYARQHAFLPVIYNRDNLSIESQSRSSNLSKLIIGEAESDDYSIRTLSSCYKVFNFIYSIDSNIYTKYQETERKMIDVDDIINCQRGTVNILETNNLDLVEEKKLYMAIHENLETESLLISILTQNIGIRLEDELIGNSEYIM